MTIFLIGFAGFGQNLQLWMQNLIFYTHPDFFVSGKQHIGSAFQWLRDFEINNILDTLLVDLEICIHPFLLWLFLCSFFKDCSHSGQLKVPSVAVFENVRSCLMRRWLVSPPLFLVTKTQMSQVKSIWNFSEKTVTALSRGKTPDKTYNTCQSVQPHWLNIQMDTVFLPCWLWLTPDSPGQLFVLFLLNFWNNSLLSDALASFMGLI